MRLSVSDICFSYGKKGREILHKVTCDFPENKVTAILGPNGCGKTTMAKCINKINIPSSGDIHFGDRSIKDLERGEIAKIVGYVPQFSSAGMAGTVMEFVMLGRRQFLGWSIKDEDIEAVAEVLEQLHISDLSDKNYSELSGGQKQKVLVARALMQDSEIYLFDEPTSNLDIKNELEIMKLARSIVDERQKSVIMVVHDLNMALHYADYAVIMKAGNVVDHGDIKRVLTEKTIDEVYGVKTKIEDCGFVNPFAK